MKKFAIVIALLATPVSAQQATQQPAQPSVVSRNLAAALDGLRGTSAAIETGIVLYAKECEGSQRSSAARIAELEAKVKEFQAKAEPGPKKE